MKLETAKLELFQMILAEKDTSVIKDLLTVFNRKNQTETDFWNELPEEIQQQLDESIAQAERGEVTPHEVVMKEYEKWNKK